MSAESLKMLAVGDLVLDMPEPEFYFKHVAPVLRSGDVVVGQLEIPHTARPVATRDWAMPAPDPDNMRGLTFAGFNVITLAGNPIWAYGTPGVEDTIGWLRDHNIAYVGAGMNIDEARKPLIIERKGTRFGFLDYNCVGPIESGATPTKPGSAYVDV